MSKILKHKFLCMLAVGTLMLLLVINAVFLSAPYPWWSSEYDGLFIGTWGDMVGTGGDTVLIKSGAGSYCVKDDVPLIVSGEVANITQRTFATSTLIQFDVPIVPATVELYEYNEETGLPECICTVYFTDDQNATIQDYVTDGGGNND